MSIAMSLDESPAGFQDQHRFHSRSIPYLAVDPERAETWSRIAPHAGSPKVGVAWAGRPTHRYDRHRSLSLERLAPLGSVGSACEVTFFSLQKGEEARGVESASRGLPVVDYTQQIDDFADTAALIANLDLIITVDTAVAHLARAWEAGVGAASLRPGLAVDDGAGGFPVVPEHATVSPDFAGRVGRRIRRMAEELGTLWRR